MLEGYYNHPINKKDRIRKEKILVSLWDFGPINPQKERKHYIDEEFAARMRPPLARALVKIYGKEPILDPMCGTGTTCIEASLLGMESYGIDIEGKNIKICQGTIPQIRGSNTLDKIFGKRTCLPMPSFMVGDARNLPFQNSSIGAIVFSPPYWNAIADKGRMSKGDGSPYIQRKGSPKTWRARAQAYGPSAGNVGSIRSYDKYLANMGSIFMECFRVLMGGSFCVAVVKDLQRDFKLVPLHCDLVTRATEVGFALYDICINRMYHSAFWNVHHAMNEQIDKQMPRSLRVHEYILVFRKE